MIQIKDDLVVNSQNQSFVQQHPVGSSRQAPPALPYHQQLPSKRLAIYF
jgi:hypothetical protein